MDILQAIVLVIGAVFLVLGYRKTHRNYMLAGALVMVAALATPDFIRGFKKGYGEALEAHQAGSP